MKEKLTNPFRAALLTLALACGTAAAQTYVVPCRSVGIGWYTNNAWEILPSGASAFGTSSGKSTAPGCPATRAGCFYRGYTTCTVGQGFSIRLTNDTDMGAVYKVYVTVPSVGNSATNLEMSLTSTNADWGSDTGAITTTRAFEDATAGNKWGFVGYLTNRTGAGYSGLHPVATFLYSSATAVSGSANTRVQYDCVKFEKLDQCMLVDPVYIPPPYLAGTTSVTVQGVAADALAVTVYQLINGAYVSKGQITTGITAGDNVVTVSGLVKGSLVCATQTRNVNGSVIEGCKGASAGMVGSGNASVRVSVNLGKSGTSSYTGPIGASGQLGSPGYFFLPNITNSATDYPQGGIVINPSTCWQTIEIDPTKMTHGNIWAGSGTGDPYPLSWARLDSIAIAMNDTNEVGPYEIYIDNLANGSTLIHDWEDAIAEGALTNAAPGLFAAYPLVGSTYPMIQTNPAVTTVACSSNSVAPNQVAGGTNAQYATWQWKQQSNPGTWMRLYCNAGGVANWPGWPQVDMSKKISFDILVLPAGQTMAHSVGTVTWMEDTNICPGEAANFSVSATAPTDPATGLPMPRSYTYQWSKDGTAIAGATQNSFSTNALVAAAGTYSVAVSDGTCTLTRSANLTVQPPVSIWQQPNTQQVVYDSQSAYFYVGASGACTLPVSYQWIKDGVPITGANSENFSISTAHVSDAGSYWAIVSNDFGSLTTVTSRLYVVDNGPIDGNGTGLLGYYYSNTAPATAFTGSPVWTNVDTVIDFNWGAGSPNESLLGTNNFAIRWFGQLQPKWAQTYTFWTTNDDGVRLWIDGKLIVDSWIGQSGSVGWSGSIALNTNLHTLLMEYYEATGNAQVHLGWESASQPPEIIAGAQFYPADAWVPPTVGLSSPANNAVFQAPATISLGALVSSNGNAITKVQFYQGTTLVGEAASAPYSFTWTPVAAGAYSIKARAVYNEISTVDSGVNNITVNAVIASPVNITGINSTSVSYSGGAGTQFVLLKAADPTASVSTWTRAATNTVSPGSFTIPVGSDGPRMFYRIKSE